MAARRKEESQTNGNGKGKIRFRYMDADRSLDFSVENMTGETVTDGLRSIANALAGRTLAIDPARRLPKNTGGGPAAVIDPELEEETPEQEEVLEQEEVETDEGEAGDGVPKPKKIRKPKAPKVLSDPVLTTAKVQLEEFMKQKGATDMQDKYAVVAVWYKQEFNITDINIDRIFTAFKLLGQESQLPTDIEKTLKNLTYVKKWFDKGKGAGNYAINWVGEDAVGKMVAGATK